MKVRVRRPSAAMCVASVALFISLGGTSVAAVSFARNAGKVDGKDAVASSATLRRAAGNVVATASRGPHKGKVPGRFLADVARSQSFGRAFEVADNGQGAAEALAAIPGVGTLQASCGDQAGAAGTEDPITSLQWVNTSGQTVNITRHRFADDLSIGSLAAGTVAPMTFGGSNTFELQVQFGPTNVLVHGTVRQDGRGTPAGLCLAYGTVLLAVQ
jgi:hypothetical protein